MSEILTIDTTSGIFKEEIVEPLKLLGENHPMLKMPIPEYLGILPSTPMDTLIKRMKMTMKLYGGIGLSANQCGVFHRVFVIGTEDFQIACINPKVTASSTEMLKDNEGCLSYPALYLKIERPSWIMASFYNENGEHVEMKMEGLTARCYQHELDHMNGIRFVEHTGPVSLRLARQKQEKLIKTITRKKKNGRWTSSMGFIFSFNDLITYIFR